MHSMASYLDIYISLRRLLEEESCARDVLKAFVHLLSIWSHSPSSENNVIPSNVLSLAIDTAESLVARSCFE